MASDRQRFMDKMLRRGYGYYTGSRKAGQSRFYKTKKYGRKMRAPVATTLRVGSMRGAKVYGSKRSKQVVTFTNREFLTNVTNNGTALFNLEYATSISPSNASVFPWLAGITDHFEEYMIKNFKVTYEPSCTSATTGQVMIAIDYDPADSNPTDWSGMSAWKGSKHGSVWAPLMHRADSNIRRRKVYYTGTNGIPSSGTAADVRDLAAGRLYVATEGVTNAGAAFAAGTIIGKLYVTYTVSLYIPQSNNDMISQAVGGGGTLYASATNLATINASAAAKDILANVELSAGFIPFIRDGVGNLICQVPFQGFVVRSIVFAGATINTNYTAITITNATFGTATQLGTTNSTTQSRSRMFLNLLPGAIVNLGQTPVFNVVPNASLFAVVFQPYPASAVIA